MNFLEKIFSYLKSVSSFILRFLKVFLPNLTIVMAIGLVILLYLDNRNPMMGFLYGEPFSLYGLVFAASSTCVAIMYYVSLHKNKQKNKNNTPNEIDDTKRNQQ